MTLTDTKSLDVARVNLDGSNYEIKYVKAARDAPPAIDTSTKFITITKATMPANAAAISADLAKLYLKNEGSGKYSIQNSNANNAQQLKCNESLFNQKSVGDCTEIKTVPPTKTILEEVQALGDSGGGETQVAVVNIEGTDYNIICKQGTDGNMDLDKGAQTITIEKADFSSIDDTALKILIKTVHVTGTKANPAVVASGGVAQLNCDNVTQDFNVATVDNQQCTQITNLPKSIAEQVKDLTSESVGSAVIAAKVSVDSDNYGIKYVKAANDAPPAIDTATKFITITKATMPVNAAAISNDLSVWYLHKDTSTGVYSIDSTSDASSKELKCSDSVFEYATPHDCTDITF